jgi:hypothetical protein
MNKILSKNKYIIPDIIRSEIKAIGHYDHEELVDRARMVCDDHNLSVVMYRRALRNLKKNVCISEKRPCTGFPNDCHLCMNEIGWLAHFSYKGKSWFQQC